MPISAAFPILQTQIQQALSLQQAAQTQTTATLMSFAISSTTSLGLYPPPLFLPLVPAGLSAGLQLIKQALSMRQAAQISTVSQMIASGISIIVPTVPPAGLSLLKTQIEQAFSMKQAAQILTVSTIITQAIITYYISAGVV